MAQRDRRAVRHRQSRLSPALILVAGFAALIALGTLLLSAPIASSAGAWTAPLDAFFTATSAVCVTGLVVADTGTHWSPFGQIVILGLIQIGGLGFMTASTLILAVLVRHRTSLRDRVLLQAATGERDLGSVTALVRRVAIFTVVVEVAGAVAIGLSLLLGGASADRAAWWGVFHSVSAFNNAGFDLFGEFRSLTPAATQPLLLASVAVVIILGGLGYAILADVFGKSSWLRLALETKVVVAATIALLLGGTVWIAVAEWTNPATLGQLPLVDRVANAAFMSVTARTAGFNAIPIGDLLVPSLMVTMALMAVGGASGSTAGGMKVNTIGVLVVTTLSTIRGRPWPEAFGRRISHDLVYRATSVALFWIAALVVATVSMLIVADVPALDAFFEATSALATVGLTTGITPGLPDPALLVLAATMFAGRLGPLTLVLALSSPPRPANWRPAVEVMRIG